MSTTPFRKVLLIGATGSIGRYVLAGLISSPSLSVTILQRESSSAKSSSTLPPSTPVITIPDSYPTSALVSAFRGHDAVISCLTTLSITDQFRFIDAAIEAGVRRYVPSEYGLNNMRADAQALCSVFRDKGAVQAYLREKATEGKIEWMSVSCGMWLKWSMQNDFLGMRVKGEGKKEMTLWDGGEGRFSVTTEENTARAVVNSLVEAPEETKNRNVLVQDFIATQREVLREIERQTGKKVVVDEIDAGERIRELQARLEKGAGQAVYGLIEAGFVTGKYGGDLEKEGEMLTDRLGLVKHSLEEVVADALASL